MRLLWRHKESLSEYSVKNKIVEFKNQNVHSFFIYFGSFKFLWAFI